MWRQLRQWQVTCDGNSGSGKSYVTATVAVASYMWRQQWQWQVTYDGNTGSGKSHMTTTLAVANKQVSYFFVIFQVSSKWEIRPRLCNFCRMRLMHFLEFRVLPAVPLGLSIRPFGRRFPTPMLNIRQHNTFFVIFFIIQIMDPLSTRIIFIQHYFRSAIYGLSFVWLICLEDASCTCHLGHRRDERGNSFIYGVILWPIPLSGRAH